MIDLAELLDRIALHTREGNRHALRPLLRELIAKRHAYHPECRRHALHAPFADALYKALLLELDEEEEESIEGAELAYLALSAALRGASRDAGREGMAVAEGEVPGGMGAAGDAPQEAAGSYGIAALLKLRLLLVHYFADYLTDAVTEVFLPTQRKDNPLQARNLALECLERMQLADMFRLEKHAPAFLEGDEQLTDACNAIETPPDLSPAERDEASLLHRVLQAHLGKKYGL